MRQPQFLNSFWMAGTISILAAQPVWAQVTQVTSIQLKPTDAGIEVILEGASGTSSQIMTSSSGNKLIVDIPNTQMRLPKGNSFRQDNPTEQISSVTVTNLDNRSLRLIVTGKAGTPTAQVTQSDKSLEISVSAANQELVERVVTATRTAENRSDVPRSVTVVTQPQIQQQATLLRDLGDILGKTVPGLAPSNQSLSNSGQTLRGRNPLVVIDGVPQSTNRDASRNLRIIDPAVIDRVEVLRGPTALYGDGATGGVINIITRSGSKGQNRFTVNTGLTGSLSHFDDSLGGNLQLGTSGKEGDFDYLLSGSFEKIGGLFDAAGDRIPPDLLSSQGSLADSQTINLFGKVGWDISSQRLQLTVNHFNTKQDTGFTSSPAVNAFPPGTQKARARRGLRLEDQSAIKNTLLNLDYTHPNLLFGSQVHAQLYYRDYLTRFFPFDGRPFGRITPEGFRTFQGRVESQKFGGRLEINTPLMEQDKLTLLSGLDYSNENAVQRVAIFDNRAYDTSNALVFNKIGDRDQIPPLNQTNLGLFAQLKWQPLERLVLESGVRYESIGLDVNNFTTLTGVKVGGGKLDYDATLFNLGAVYKLTNQVNLFADFSQGFSVADVGLILRDARTGFSVTSLRPEAQKVNNYEIGVRGEWSTLQASLSGFYNDSSLGTTFDRNTLAVIRAPERIYGLEATIDVQPTKRWSLGSTASYVEGENDVNRNGNYKALNGFRISPLKLTAYVENETLPGWRNRLQLLYSGNRDRAFNEGVDFRKVTEYVTLDFISSLKLGSGKLQLGIQNLFNNEYFTATSQLVRLRTNDSYTAAPGRTFSLQYSVEF